MQDDEELRRVVGSCLRCSCSFAHLEGKYLIWCEHHVMMHDDLPSGHPHLLHGLGKLLLACLTVLILHYLETACTV